LRGLIGDAQALPPQTPTVGRGQRQGEAGFVQMAQVDQTRVAFFTRTAKLT
jgi:hypothetical protein